MANSVGDQVLKMVLAQANKEQSQHYPPHVYTTHFRLVSEALKDECIRLYPTEQLVVDLLMPFINTQLCWVKNGAVALPPNYRNMLGIGFHIKDRTNFFPFELDPVYFEDALNPTSEELATAIAKSNSETKPLDMLTIGEWDEMINHPYKSPNKIDFKTKKPNFNSAKSCIFGGKIGIRIAPFAIPYVEMRWVIDNPNPFVYGYQELPDDTYMFDPASTTEDLWKTNAVEYLAKGVNILFANYIRDKDYIASARDLRENSFF
jgi:hypothetical protein